MWHKISVTKPYFIKQTRCRVGGSRKIKNMKLRCSNTTTKTYENDKLVLNKFLRLRKIADSLKFWSRKFFYRQLFRTFTIKF